ncbi:MAG TPA: substrate-binding domain-containing protein [Solirubrobacteraceae bacterium]|nr:substrate-binding domain-containing protein [Solirubrobacteraceae bacterium]
MSHNEITDPAVREEVDWTLEAMASGRMTRSQFVRRAAALGLSGGFISSVLAAPALAAGPTSLAQLTKLVYPQGITKATDYNGPNGGSKVAYLPPDFHSGVDSHGIWKWKFENVKAKKNYRFALAHFSAKWDLMVESVARFKRFGQKAGFSVTAFDNNFDADQAIKNANAIAQQRFDFVIMEQEFADANKTIDGILKNAGIPVIYFAVPGPEGALFMDTGNYRMCEAAGEWLGKYAKEHWGGKVDLVLQSAQPRAGAYVGQREVGYKAGIKKVLPHLKDSVFVKFDGQGLLPETQKLAADLLTKHSSAKYILGTGSNDDAGVGIVRALEAAKRTKYAAVAGQAGQASAMTELSKPSSPFKVSAFQDVEAEVWMAAIGLLKVEGGKVAPVNFYPFYLTTKSNVKKFPPQAGTLTKA